MLTRQAPYVVAAAGLLVAGAIAAVVLTVVSPAPASPTARLRSAARLFLTKGVAAESAHQFAQANADYLRALENQPRTATAWYDLGVIAQQQGFGKSAQADYERAVKVDPADDLALYNLATLIQSRAPAAAARLYRDVLRRDPADAAARLNLGLILEQEHTATAAGRLIDEALRIDPFLGGHSRGAPLARAGAATARTGS